MWMMQQNPTVSDLTFQVAGDTYGFVDYELPVDFEGRTVMFGGVLFDPIVCSMPAALCWSLVIVIPLVFVALAACVAAMWRQRLRAR
jgi:hypothetical protein